MPGTRTVSCVVPCSPEDSATSKWRHSLWIVSVPRDLTMDHEKGRVVVRGKTLGPSAFN